MGQGQICDPISLPEKLRALEPQHGLDSVARCDVVLHHVQAVDLLKCDVEGAELLFLRSYPELLRSVRTVVMELHPELCDADECLRLLGEYGLARQTVLRAGDFGSTVLAHR